MGGGNAKATKYQAASPPDDTFAGVLTDTEARHFNARWENILEWESINTPASRQGLAILLQIDEEKRCDPWLWRPLHYMALYGVSGAVEALVEAKAEVDARTGGPSIIGRQLTKETFNFCAELECLIRGKPVRVRAEEVSGDSITIMKADNVSARWTTTLSNCRCVDYAPINPPVHLRHFNHVTPLHIAIEFQHVDTIRALLKGMADPNFAWNQGRNMPLHTSIWQGHYKAVSELLKYQADANREDCWSRTPLATAAICPKKPPRLIAVMLLEAGARRAATDSLGKTAAQLALESDNTGFAEAVESYVLGQWKERAEQKRLDMKWLNDTPRSDTDSDNFQRRLSNVKWERLQPEFPQAFARIAYHPPPISTLVKTPAASPSADIHAAGAIAREVNPLGSYGLNSPPASGEPSPREGADRLQPPPLGQAPDFQGGGAPRNSAYVGPPPPWVPQGELRNTIN